MKYRISEHIIIKNEKNETFKDIIYHELEELDFFTEYLKNPRLAYWTIDDSGVKKFYKNTELQVTIDGDNIINHSFVAKHLRNFDKTQP